MDSWLRALGLAVVLLILVRTFIVEAFQIPSASMERTLLVGDFLFVNKAAYGAEVPGTRVHTPAFRMPQRGDVAVFAYPRNPDLNYVKRVIGIPGDTVEMRAGEVTVDGETLREPYVQRADPWHDLYDPTFAWQCAYELAPRPACRPTRDTWGPLVVPAHKYFVLGDNRDNSEDSRYWGFVDRDAFRGKPLFVYFSYDREAKDALPWLFDIRWRRLGTIVR